jgi:hypothetical protein
MRLPFPARRLRSLFVPAVAVALGISLATPRLAHAQLSGCQSDPVLVLSNLTEIDLHASIADSSDDVQQVIYTVHAPVGTSLVTYTPGLLGPKQVVQFVADQDSGHYTTTIVVDTGTGGVDVTATTQALALLGAALATVSGVSHQPLTVALTL